MSQTERLYWLDAQIRAERYPNADRVAAHFEVSRRTGFADRTYLLDRLGAPLKTDKRKGGWYYTDPTFVLPFLALSEPEAAVLRRSLLAAQEYLGESDTTLLQGLRERLSPFL